MKQFFYKLIYHRQANYLLRNVNRLIYPILPKKFRIPPSGTISIKVNNQTVLIETNQTSYITQLVFWEGYQNFEYTALFLNLIKDMDCFYDVGANIGFYSLLAAATNPGIKIVSFEPAIGPLCYLRKNAQLNNFSNIIIEPIALSHKTGEIEFYEVQNQKYKYLTYNLAGEGNAGSKKTQRNFKRNTVKTLTLDRYVVEKNEKKIDLIKLDTEGTEHLILKNADRVLAEMKPIVICETLFNAIESELEEIMKSYGYDFYNHVPNGLQKVNSIKRKEDNGVRNCFFVHPSKVGLINKFVVH